MSKMVHEDTMAVQVQKGASREQHSLRRFLEASEREPHFRLWARSRYRAEWWEAIPKEQETFRLLQLSN